MTVNSISAVRNGEKVGLANLPPVAFGEFRDTIVSAVKAGARLSALFGAKVQEADVQGSHAAPGLGNLRLFAVLAQEAEGTLAVTSTRVRDMYPALTPGCPQAHLVRTRNRRAVGSKARRTSVVETDSFSSFLP